MLVPQQGVSGTEKKDRRKQIPLDLKPAIGAAADRIAHDRITGAHEDRDENQPIDEPADKLIEPVDKPANTQKELHEPSVPHTARQRVTPHRLGGDDYGMAAVSGPAVSFVNDMLWK